MTTKPIIRATVVAACASLSFAVPAAGGYRHRVTSQPSYVPGEVVVGYSAPAIAARVQHATRLTPVSAAASDVQVLRLPRGQSVAAAASRLRALKGVAYAVPDYLAHIASAAPWIPDDPGRVHQAEGWQKTQWNLLPGSGVDAPGAWGNLIAAGHPGGRGAVIAVLDTGVAYRNWGQFARSPDFGGTRFTDPYDFVAGNALHIEGRTLERPKMPPQSSRQRRPPMNKPVPQSDMQSEARPRFETENPATGQKGRVYEGRTKSEVRDIVVAVDRASKKWRRRSYSERAAMMKEAAAVLRRKKDEFAALMTEEMGKPISDGRAEVEKCATACDYFADNAERFLAQEKVDLGGPEAFITFEPLGIILAIMPWNFPFWQVFRFAAPTLMTGNVALLKHASNVPGCALAIETVFRDAGFPDDVFRTLLIPSRDVESVIDMKEVRAVTLTGSVEAGRKVATAAAQRLKKSVLELGGSDPYVVLEDADMVKAAKICATARMVNAGQSCIAGKRFIVVEKVRDQFEKAFVEAMQSFQMADPRDDSTKFGPMYSVAGRDELHEQVERSVAAGARVLTGGDKPEKAGAWYPPTVLTDVKPGVPAFQEEIFGPVASVIVAKDEADAIAMANDSEFGLGSAVITRDLDRGRRIAAHELQSGMSFVNDNVRSDARMPFGGLKHSGYGREVSRYGLLEFVNIKSVLVTPMA